MIFLEKIIISVLIRVLCQTNKRKIKLKGYNQTMNNHRYKNSNLNLVNHKFLFKFRLSKIDRRSDRTTALLTAILILFLITELPQAILGLFSGFLGSCFLSKCYHISGNLMDLMALINGAFVFILYVRLISWSLFMQSRNNQ